MPLEFEASEVADLFLDCPPGCAYCCLCPPGLLEGEAGPILDKCGCQGECLGKDRIGDAEQAAKVHGQGGACIFLEDLRCSVYDSRPHFCRQYPLQVYSGWRLQLSGVRSCRGLTNNGKEHGSSLMDMLKNEISALGEDYFLDTLEETRTSFDELKDETRIYASIEEVQEIAFRVADTVGDAKAMASLLKIDNGKDEQSKEALLDMFWSEIGATFSGTDVLELPVYNTPDHTWRVFKLVSEAEMSRYQLHPSGTMVHQESQPLGQLGLKVMDRGGSMGLRSYLTLAFRRDIFYGMVAREALVEGVNMVDVARSVAARTAVDIWWRAGLLKAFADNETRDLIGKEDAREAMVFMDADLLDSFALGAII